MEYLSCLHTTVASAVDHEVLHIVPHSPFLQISTRPSLADSPPTNLTSEPEQEALVKKSE